MFDHLEPLAGVLKELAAEELRDWSDGELDEAVVDAPRLLSALHASVAVRCSGSAV